MSLSIIPSWITSIFLLTQIIRSSICKSSIENLYISFIIIYNNIHYTILIHIFNKHLEYSFQNWRRWWNFSSKDILIQTCNTSIYIKDSSIIQINSQLIIICNNKNIIISITICVSNKNIFKTNSHVHQLLHIPQIWSTSVVFSQFNSSIYINNK